MAAPSWSPSTRVCRPAWRRRTTSSGGEWRWSGWPPSSKGDRPPRTGLDGGVVHGDILGDEHRPAVLPGSGTRDVGPSGRTPSVILPKVPDLRLVTIRRGGTLTDTDHHLLALWA